MMSKPSLPNDSSRALYEAFELAQKSAKLGERKFWLLSVSWALMIIALSVYFSLVLRDFSSRHDVFSADQARLTDFVQRQGRRIARLAENNARFQGQADRLQRALAAQLSPEARNRHVLEVAGGQLARQGLTNWESDFLSSQAELLRSDETPESHYVQGMAAIAAKKYEDASSSFSRAIELRPSYQEAYAGDGLALVELGRYEESLTRYTAAIDRGATAVAHARRAWPLIRLQRYQDALDDCNKAVEENGDYWLGYHYRGFANYGLQNDAEAERDWRTAAELRPEPRQSLENVGLIYLRALDWEKALENARQVNLIDDGSAWNWLFLYIAADRLGHETTSLGAKRRWEALKTPEIIRSLRRYLPSDLQSYLPQG